MFERAARRTGDPKDKKISPEKRINVVKCKALLRATDILIVRKKRKKKKERKKENLKF